MEILERDWFSEQDILDLLNLRRQENIQHLFDKSLALTRELIGNKVFFRGIIEFSNRCEKNCFYCGIRRENTTISRYLLTGEEILAGALWAEENRYGSLVLQSGECTSPEFVLFLEEVIRRIKKTTSLGITLSVGEQSRETYQRFFDAGAHRYLLRIETSNPELYRRIHPRDHSFEKRLECLRTLKEIGMQVGTGVMIGLPFQTVPDLAKDILFFQREDIDMIGMGPYIIHTRTPLATHETIESWNAGKKGILDQTLKMIAVARLVLRDVNIASTTALQAIHPRGREMGLKAGANVIMPIITPGRYRESYLLYEGKPCIDDSAEVCRDCLSERIHSTGREIAWDEWGDPLHFQSRQR
ncbi:MAG: [FeFe] hydrogenase H-cluster radical SAM maturase HydE [Candidatus Latescibacter sp.]|nr:[FeFe] hydrogenase H-cluster radical SAM maturase HydE [Candidatus Latescibacter sp.]